MKLRLIFISILLLGYGAAYTLGDAATECDAKLYTCYEEHVKNTCTNPKMLWGTGGKISVDRTSYPKLTIANIDATTANLSSAQTSPEQKNEIQKKIDILNGSVFDGFRATEAARLIYRSNMNNTFSCAIIANRVDKLEQLESIVGKNSKASDILKALEKEKNKYKNLQGPK